MPALHGMAHPKGLGSDPKNKKARDVKLTLKISELAERLMRGGLEENPINTLLS